MLGARTRRPVSLPPRPMTRALQPSTQSTWSTRPSSALVAQERSRGSGRMGGGSRRARPDRGPRRSSRQPAARARSARSRKRQMRSPSAVFTSSPTMTVSPAGAASRARSASSIRSWSVIARWVSPRSGRPAPRHRDRRANRSCRACGSGGRRRPVPGGRPLVRTSATSAPRRWSSTEVRGGAQRRHRARVSDLLDERLLEEVEVLEGEARPERDAVQRRSRRRGTARRSPGSGACRCCAAARPPPDITMPLSMMSELQLRRRLLEHRAGPRRRAAGAAPRWPP